VIAADKEQASLAIADSLATTTETRRLPAAEGASQGLRFGLGLATWAVLVISLVVLVPTVGDFGVTWDEPQYRHSQLLSAQWWRQVAQARSWADLAVLVDPITLLYHWDYGHYGMNFHPPLAGHLNLAAYGVFGHWMKDLPSRRMASVIEFAVTVTIGFHFLARRYGPWVGVVMAGSLLLMPRLYGQAHLMDTDIPGLLLWSATALAFWSLSKRWERSWSSCRSGSGCSWDIFRGR
jgi:hypothetical protein